MGKVLFWIWLISFVPASVFVLEMVRKMNSVLYATLLIVYLIVYFVGSFFISY